MRYAQYRFCAWSIHGAFKRLAWLVASVGIDDLERSIFAGAKNSTDCKSSASSLLHLSALSRLGCGPTGGTKAQTTSPNAHQTHPRSPGAQLGHEFNQFRPTGGSYAAALLGLPNPILTATRGTLPPVTSGPPS